LSVFDAGKQLPLGDAVASQLVCHDYPRRILQTLEQLAEEAPGGFGIPPGLNEEVKHDAILIHGTPEMVLHTLDPGEHLVEVPLIPAAAQAVGKALAEFLAPAPHGLIGPIMTNSTGPSGRTGRGHSLMTLHLFYPPGKDFVIVPRYRHVLMLSLEQGDR
jgi:hypothetical protein